ncbi:MAG: hypothetical protein A2Y89_01805 [Chloroflexi bacterium RBG_13_51_18]|nr:MAG: hypothetical protein A2Y89_01805 [Chloroflexi bacterium RBG_13_51_18]
MRYAEVSVNSPAAQRRTFSYAIPPGLDVGVGQAVIVPFGEKVLQGVVLEVTPLPAVEDTREILGTIETSPILSKYQIQLARWISDYYLAPVFSAVALMLPPAFERKALTFISPVNPDIDIDSLNEEQKKVMALSVEKGSVGLRQVEKVLGKKRAGAVILQMVRQGLINRSYELAPVRMKPKTELYISLVERVWDEIR